MAQTGWSKFLTQSAFLAILPAVGWLGYEALSARAPDELLTIAATFAAVAGTLLGFVIAALAIVASLMDRTLVANLKRTGHFSVLLRELHLSAGAFVVVVVAAMVSLFLTDEPLRMGVAISAAAQAYGTLFLVLSGRKFYLVVSHVT